MWLRGAAGKTNGELEGEDEEEEEEEEEEDDKEEADLLSRMPEFVHVGARFTSSKRVPLSEVGTEYEVVCTKHLYASHLILAFQLPIRLPSGASKPHGTSPSQHFPGATENPCLCPPGLGLFPAVAL